MGFQFQLCADCLEQYRALRFDPKAKYSMNTMPLCSLQWSDEHPPDGLMSGHENYLSGHEICKASMTRLIWARTYFWRNRIIPSESNDLWHSARRIIPEWSGFHRLSLSAREKKALDACTEELEDLMVAIHNDFPQMEMHDAGGGLSWIAANRRGADSAGAGIGGSKQWWQFWR